MKKLEHTFSYFSAIATLLLAVATFGLAFWTREAVKDSAESTLLFKQAVEELKSSRLAAQTISNVTIEDSKDLVATRITPTGQEPIVPVSKNKFFFETLENSQWLNVAIKNEGSVSATVSLNLAISPKNGGPEVECKSTETKTIERGQTIDFFVYVAGDFLKAKVSRIGPFEARVEFNHK